MKGISGVLAKLNLCLNLNTYRVVNLGIDTSDIGPRLEGVVGLVIKNKYILLHNHC